MSLKEYLLDKQMDEKLGKGTFNVKNEDFSDVIKKFKDRNKQAGAELCQAQVPV